jgi:hypothetical protein
MIRLIAKTRFRVGIVLLICGFLFVASLALIIFAVTAGANPSGPNPVGVLGVITGIISAAGTIATMILAWRADIGASSESKRKIAQLQQTIVDLQCKLPE